MPEGRIGDHDELAIYGARAFLRNAAAKYAKELLVYVFSDELLLRAEKFVRIARLMNHAVGDEMENDAGEPMPCLRAAGGRLVPLPIAFADEVGDELLILAEQEQTPCKNDSRKRRARKRAASEAWDRVELLASQFLRSREIIA